MRKIALFLIPLAILACKEPDLTVNNPSPAKENVYLGTSFIYNGEGFSPDSVITNSQGLSFFITEIQFVVSDFYIKSEKTGDTVAFTEHPFIVSYSDFDQPLVVLEPGGYSSTYGLRIGLDSLASATLKRSDLPPGNELIDAGVFRADGNGVDNMVFKGRLIDPDDPLDTIGTIPLEYRLGTYATSRVFTSLQQNYSVAEDSKVKLIMQIDIGPLFDDFDLELKPLLITDPSNVINYELAVDMAERLEVGLF